MPRKILIVDDNAINRQMLINALYKDYDIIEAENGKQALTLMHRNYKVLSAVLLDIAMPEVDGYDVLRSVRENALLSQIPIIMVTGSEDEDARVKVLSLGANDFILKPFNPDIVKHCLRNNIALRETASILNAIQRDKLTGLYNREAFFEKAGIAIKDREPGYYSLSCFDIDNFKLINDQYGAIEGDQILKEIGNVIKSSICDTDGLAGRISADNFAMLIPTNENENDIVLNILDKKLSTLQQRSVVFSIGRYLITDTTLPVSAIYDRAYLAKQSVKGRYDKHLAYFDEDMLKKLVRDQQIVSDMEAALSERQFEVWFQPQYNHVTGALAGAEALVRWRHPQKGIISPGDFIPLFEQNGFVYELDKYIWRETCRYLRKWLDEGFSPLSVSVNISRYDIFRVDLVDVISGLVSEYKLPIDLLRLEITESAFAKSTKLIVGIVKKLISLGFTVEIDDFGSGYSSLNTLKDVPAQVVKLDMRFLDGGDDAQRGGNILESIVRMTKWLGMAVIAEGVESAEQSSFLKSIGCSHVQGYLYAKPMPASDYENLLKSNNTERQLPHLETADNLDNDMFWNPKSMDSLIFNSYVGSACIYEYHDGKIELVRATDKYARMLGGDAMTVDKLIKLDLMDYIDKNDALRMANEINSFSTNKGEIVSEYMFHGIPGCSEDIYVRSTMRVIARAENRYLIYCISENITAQRVSERKERKAMKQLQVIMNNVNCGITAVTIDGKLIEFLLANDKYYELLGYTKEQYDVEIGSEASATIFPEDLNHVKAIIERTYATCIPASMEYRVTRRDGQAAWLRSFLLMTYFEGIDKPVQLCTFADITAEKHTAQNLLDNLPCGAGICTVTENDARMTYLNKRYFTYFKHNSGLKRATSVFKLIHPDDHAILRSAMLPALDKGGKESCVVRIIDGANDYISFRITGIALESTGDTNSIYVTFVPIEHEELSFSEMMSVALKQMMVSSSDLCFVKDKNLRYICCSHAFAKMAGLKSEKDVIGKSDYDLFDESLAAQYVADDQKLISNGKSIIDMVEIIPSADGRNRYSSTSKYLLYDSWGTIIGIYGAGRDVTKSRKAEMQQKFLINNIPGGVAIYEGKWSNPDTIKLAYFSDGFCKLFGYTRKEYDKLGKANPTGLIVKEHIPGLLAQIETLIHSGTPIDYIFQAHTKNDTDCWIHIKAVLAEKRRDTITVNALLFDVTEHEETLERLRVSEEENRLAMRHSENQVCRYDVATKSLKLSPDANSIFEMSAIVDNVPLSQVENGKISSETAEAYAEFYNRILRGEKSGSVIYQRKSLLGWRWINAHSSTIYSSVGTPIAAVISYIDVTESFEKDLAYKKWTQSLRNRDLSSYSLYKCNISKNTIIDTVEGSLIHIQLTPGVLSFNSYVSEYIEQCVYDEDKEHIGAFLNIDALLENYFHGKRMIAIEYREKLLTGDYRWLRLTADLMESSHSTDVEAYLLYENIDKVKRAELLTIERAETDALTGLYNRATFAEKVNELIHNGGAKAQHALIMLDIDGFKLVNDVFGHGAGDQTLIDIAGLLRTVLRRGDLVGRLGGDEFVVFLGNIYEDRVAASKARQICELSRKAYSMEVQISGSVGIALYPHDGISFETLYKKADKTLYHVKNSGGDNFAFYHEDMRNEHDGQEHAISRMRTNVIRKKKRRMLIVDDSGIDNELLANIFQSDFIVEKASDGNTALVRLRHYGSAISIVLLDLIMPVMDGFMVLEAMRNTPEMQSIPIVVVSGADDRETSLKAIRAGASDFVTKPIDADILRIRVQSAISKADNERLRAKNSSLELQTVETLMYKTVLDKLGLGVTEVDIAKSTFEYSPSMSQYLAGKYDSRTLWHIFLSDSVADAQTVTDIQQSIQQLSDCDNESEAHITVRLKTPLGERHDFRIYLYKQLIGCNKKMILTFKDVETEQIRRRNEKV